MNKEQLAITLHGRHIGNETTAEMEAQAKAAGLVIVFGASDDLMEFRGAIDDEVGCYEGGSAYITKDGLFDEGECESECKYFQAAKSQATEIKALWCKEEPYSWTFKTDIPHATFDIFEDGEKFCRGIVFSLADVR